MLTSLKKGNLKCVICFCLLFTKPSSSVVIRRI